MKMPSFLRPLLFLAVLLLLLGEILCASIADYRKHIAPYEDMMSATASPATWRQQKIASHGHDPFFWIRMAQISQQTGQLRVHWIDFDNTPYGRPMHWSSPFVWWIRLCGALQETLTGQPPVVAIYRASLWCNPALLALFLLGFGLLVARRFGWIPATLTLLAVGHAPCVWEYFPYAFPDHHGWHAVAFIGLLLGIVAGGSGFVLPSASPAALWPADEIAARRWFHLSAFFGALGLWMGASQTAIILGGLGLGVLLSGILTLSPSQSPQPAFHPGLWRVWGWAGAAWSFLFYLIEYFPSGMAMRLEVNHPLYSLAWGCGGEILFRLLSFIHSRNLPSLPSLFTLILPLAGASLLPLSILLGDPEWHILRDPRILRLFDFLGEWTPLYDWLHLPSIQGFTALFALPALALATLSIRTPMPTRRALLPLLVLDFILLAFTIAQNRWLGLFTLACSLSLLALLLHVGSPSTARVPRRLLHPAAALLALILANFFLFANIQISRFFQTPMPPPNQGGELTAFSHLADDLQATRPGATIRLMAEEHFSHIIFVSQAEVVTTMFWENSAGVIAYGEFFGDESDDARIAHDIALRRGLTHVIIRRNPSAAATAYWFAHGSYDAAGISRTLAWNLARPNGHIPSWLRPVSLPSLTSESYLSSSATCIYEIIPPPAPVSLK